MSPLSSRVVHMFRVIHSYPSSIPLTTFLANVDELMLHETGSTQVWKAEAFLHGREAPLQHPVTPPSSSHWASPLHMTVLGWAMLLYSTPFYSSAFSSPDQTQPCTHPFSRLPSAGVATTRYGVLLSSLRDRTRTLGNRLRGLI